MNGNQRAGRLVLTSMLVAGAVFSGATAVQAQPETGSIGVFGDQAGTMTQINVSGFAPFNLYVVAMGPPGGIRGYEFGLDLNPAYTRLGEEYVGQGPIDPPPGSTDWIVGLATCYEQTPLQLLKLTLGYFLGPVAPSDDAICVRPSRASTVLGSLSYVDCAGSTHPFDPIPDPCNFTPDGCLLVNPTQNCPIPIEARSFTSLKSCYRPR